MIILRKKSMVFVYTAIGVLCVEHANVLKLCYIELFSGDRSFRLFSLVDSLTHTRCVETKMFVSVNL